MKFKPTLVAAVLLAIATGTAMAQQPAGQQQQRQNPTFQKAPGTTPPNPATAPTAAGGGHQHHCQGHQQGHQCKHKAQAQDGMAQAINKAFPEAKKTVKGEPLTEVLDAQGKLLGYVLCSQPASNGIKGYNGETPLLIALSPKKRVLSVQLLPNQEGRRFVQSVEQAGLLDSWNGLKIKKARKKKVDTVSGATFTSRAIIQSMQKALDNLQ